MTAIVVGGLVLLALIVFELPGRVVITDGTDAHLRTAGQTTGSPHQAERLALDVFERVNAERLVRGLDQLVWDDELAVKAGVWSQRMTVEGFEHSDGAFRATRRYPGTGENIALGQLDTRELHVGWMRSDGHRANLLSPDARALGVGIVCRGDGTLWATQIFGFAPADPTADLTAAPEMPPVDPIVGTTRGVICPLDARG